MIYKNLTITFIFIISFSNSLYSAYCDDGDMVNIFESDVWRLDLQTVNEDGQVQDRYEFLFTFSQKQTNSLKLSRVYKFPKIIKTEPKKHYYARKVQILNGAVEVSPLKILNFSFSQANSLFSMKPYDPNTQSTRTFCVYTMNIDAYQYPSSSGLEYDYYAKFRLKIYANEYQQNYGKYTPFLIDSESIFFEYNDEAGDADKQVTGTLRKVEITY